MPSSRLSRRLQTIADMVPPCGRVLDIGTDHALLPISLIRLGRCSEALAIDIRSGPLRAAERNIRKAGLEQQIGLLQNDGLLGIATRDDDVMVLAGLGGNEIRDILAQEIKHMKRTIIQAQKSLPELRVWLSGHDYTISDEKIVQDQARYYVVLSCQRNNSTPSVKPPADGGAHEAGKPLGRLEAWVGPVLLRDQPPELAAYLKTLLPRLNKMLQADPTLLKLIKEIEKMAGAESRKTGQAR